MTKWQRKIAASAAKRDEEIDLSEMPEVSDWSGPRWGKFYRPPRKPVTMRLDADLVEWLKSYGPGYQTKANMLLRHAMHSTQAEKPGGKRRRRRRFVCLKVGPILLARSHPSKIGLGGAPRQGHRSRSRAMGQAQA